MRLLDLYHNTALVFPAFFNRGVPCPNFQAASLVAPWQEDADAGDWEEPELSDAALNPPANPFCCPDPGNPASRPSARKTERGDFKAGIRSSCAN